MFKSTTTVSSLLACFDVKSDKGNSSIDIRPPFVEMMGKLKVNISEFDGLVQNTLPHMKVKSTFDWSNEDNLMERISKYSNLTPLSDENEKGSPRRFVASLPYSSDVVCVVINKTKVGEVDIYCDNPVATNEVMRAVKAAAIIK